MSGANITVMSSINDYIIGKHAPITTRIQIDVLYNTVEAVLELQK